MTDTSQIIISHCPKGPNTSNLKSPKINAHWRTTQALYILISRKIFFLKKYYWLLNCPSSQDHLSQTLVM